MKNLPLILFFTITFNIHAQTIAPDITLTDIHGVSRNLYSELDAGKQVILEFFMTNCGTCQVNTPVLENYWQNYGFSGDSVWVWSIEVNNASDSAIEAFYNQYPATFPAFSTINDTVVVSDYNVTYTPMYFAICPNKFMKNVSIVSIGNNDVACPSTLNNDLNTFTSDEITYSAKDNLLFVKMNSLDDSDELSIYSMSGKLTYRTKLENKDLCLNMNSFVNGLYFVSINSRFGNIKTTKVFINK